MFDLAVNDLGLTRARLSVQSGAENGTDWAGTVVERRDHEAAVPISIGTRSRTTTATPTRINHRGSTSRLLDYQIDRLIRPLRAARASLAAKRPTSRSSTWTSGTRRSSTTTTRRSTPSSCWRCSSTCAPSTGSCPTASTSCNEPNDVHGMDAARTSASAIVATAAKLRGAGFAVPRVHRAIRHRA